MPSRTSLMSLVLLLSAALPSLGTEKAQLISAKKIWDRGAHNAFTDLVRHGDRWYCVFREGKGHVSPVATVRVLASKNGDHWKSVALLTRDHADLRDPKISVAPDGRLMILAAAAWHKKGVKVHHQPMVWFSSDGKKWTKGIDVAEPNLWLWRVTWHKGVARGVSYGQVDGKRITRLYESPDGIHYKTLVPTLHDAGYPNETAIRYLADGTALCLLRRDGSPNNGLLGTSKSPYTKWSWQDLGRRIGGPEMIILDDGRIVVACRLYDKKVRTSLCWLDRSGGKLTEFLSLPSGGDTSYAGLAEHDGQLLVSYYSSHEGKTSIYFARVSLPKATSSK